MVKIKHKDIRVIDETFDMSGGYVLDFSDRTFREFFEDEFNGMDLEEDKYCKEGGQKLNDYEPLFASKSPR